MVKSKVASSAIGILCPILLGSIITITNYELTAIIIAIISAIQILLSFFIKEEKDTNLSKFNLIKTWKHLKDNKQIKKMCIVEFFSGRECILNLGRITGYTMLLIAGIIGNQIICAAKELFGYCTATIVSFRIS